MTWTFYDVGNGSYDYNVTVHTKGLFTSGICYAIVVARNIG